MYQLVSVCFYIIVESRQNNNNEGYENRALVSFDESDNLVPGTSRKPTGIVPPLKLLQKQETEMKALYGNVSDTKVPLNKLEEYIQKKHKEANGFKNEYGVSVIRMYSEFCKM